MTICYKMGNVQDTQSNSVFHQELPNTAGSPPEVPRRTKPATPPGDSGAIDHDYEILLPSYTPVRPAPVPPMPAQPLGASDQGHSPPCGTLHAHTGLEGVPFVLSPRLQAGGAQAQGAAPIPHVRARSMAQLDKDYNYDFRVERHT